MRYSIVLFGFFFSLFICRSNAQKGIAFKTVFRDVERQTDIMLLNISQKNGKNNDLIMPRTLENGELKLVRSGDWTSGFFPGQLWFLYEFTKDKKWKSLADSMTRLLAKEQYNAGTHDMGFKIYCSYGNGYRLTKEDAYKTVIIQSAKTLSQRFNSKVGCIRSWDHNREKWQFPVIIDNMMNLELLFAATRFTGDSAYYKIAVTHANTTMENHFRDDMSSYHVVDYNTSTGKVIQKGTHQGYADASAWARGQAWGLYGYTMCYRETRDPGYLQQAEKIAAFIFNNPALPRDLIPYWDYNDPKIPNSPRDASAAAIAASALFELSTYSAHKDYYRMLANTVLFNLTKSYRSAVGKNSGFILFHSTGHLPAGGEIDVPLNYADYYYLEALLRSKHEIWKQKEM